MLKNKILREITFLLEHSGIPYWIESGTLLGMMREKDHLPTHRNIDIGIPASSLNRFFVLRQRMAPRYRVKPLGNQSGKRWIDGEFSRFHISRMWGQIRDAGVKIIIKVKYRQKGVYSWVDHRSCKSVPAHFYDNLDTIRFDGRDYPIPSDGHNYLTTCYGEWQTPHKYFQNRIDDPAIADDNTLKSTPVLIKPKASGCRKSKAIRLEGYSLKRMQRMFFNTIDLFEKHGIKFWLDDDTLLGIIRQDGFLPWNHDMNLGIAGESVPRLSALRYNFLPTYLLQKKTIDSLWVPGGIWTFNVKPIWEKMVNINIHLNLFAKYKVGDRYQWIDGVVLKHIACKCYDNLDHVKWEGRTIPIPSHPEDYLALRYGDWRTPTQSFDPSMEDGAIAEKGF